MKWNITFSYLAGAPDQIEGDPLAWCQEKASAKKVRKDRPAIGKLSVEAYTDELRVFFVRNGKRICFANFQAAE